MKFDSDSEVLQICTARNFTDENYEEDCKLEQQLRAGPETESIQAELDKCRIEISQLKE